MSQIKTSLKMQDIKFDRGVGSVGVQANPKYRLPTNKGMVSVNGAAVPNMVKELFAKNFALPWEVIDAPKLPCDSSLLSPVNFDIMTKECSELLKAIEPDAAMVLADLKMDRELVRKSINLLQKA